MKRNLIKTFVTANPQVEVTFNKTDGTERVMLCTTQDHMITEENKPIGADVPENESIARVFDIEKDAWRSFRINSVTRLVGMNAVGAINDIVETFED